MPSPTLTRDQDNLKRATKLERQGYLLVAKAHFGLRVNNLVNVESDTSINFKKKQHESIDQIEAWAATMVALVDDAALKARWQRLCK